MACGPFVKAPPQPSAATRTRSKPCMKRWPRSSRRFPNSSPRRLPLPQPAAPPRAAAVREPPRYDAAAHAEPATQEPVTPQPDPLAGTDDFIAAARRAAQAAATRPSALRAEYAVLTQPTAEEKPSKLAFLQRWRSKLGPAAPKAERTIAGVSASPAAEPAVSRRTLVIAGLVLLMAASVFAYRSLSSPSAPAVQQSGGVQMTAPSVVASAPATAPLPAPVAKPASSAAPAKAALQVAPQDPVVTGSLPAASQPVVAPKPSAAALNMPPPEAGTQALRSAAASGDARAQFIVAGRYLDGQGVTQDFAKALFWYQQAAASGLAPAQYRLATLYELGKGTSANPTQALIWYERAALGGNVKAMHNAAVIAAGDKAGPADFSRAFRWFKAAAERGFSDSQFNLAILYERGLGTVASMADAYVWYTLAAKQGDPDSAVRAAALAKKLPAVDLKAANARIASWAPTPSDDSANVVTVIDPSWNDARQTAPVKQSS